MSGLWLFVFFLFYRSFGSGTPKFVQPSVGSCLETAHVSRLRHSEEVSSKSWTRWFHEAFYGGPFSPQLLLQRFHGEHIGVVVLFSNCKLFVNFEPVTEGLRSHLALVSLLKYLAYFVDAHCDALPSDSILFWTPVTTKILPKDRSQLFRPIFVTDDRIPDALFGVKYWINRQIGLRNGNPRTHGGARVMSYHYSLPPRSFVLTTFDGTFMSSLLSFLTADDNESSGKVIHKFDKRKKVAIFRGDATAKRDIGFDDMFRVKMVRFSLRNPHLIDARLTGTNRTLKTFHNKQNAHLWTTSHLDDFQQMAFKYVIVCDGFSKPDRFARQLLYGSVILKQVTDTHELFYHDLVPFLHFVPFETVGDLRIAVTNLQRLDSDSTADIELKAITFEGMKWVLNHFTVDYFDCHSLRTFELYCSRYPSMCDSNASFKRLAADSGFELRQWYNATKATDYPLEHSLCDSQPTKCDAVYAKAFSKKDIDAIVGLENETWNNDELASMKRVIRRRAHLIYGDTSNAQRLVKTAMFYANGLHRFDRDSDDAIIDRFYPGAVSESSLSAELCVLVASTGALLLLCLFCRRTKLGRFFVKTNALKAM